MQIPRLIALCGRPSAGKTTVQELLKKLYGVMPVDDGAPLRDFCRNSLGMSWDDVYTQEGKSGFVEILGKRWERRKLLGELGNRFEEMFGDHILPYMATRDLLDDHAFSFGSCRRDQGLFYKNQRGVVIGVENLNAPHSPHEFDQFDEHVVDVWISNTWQGKAKSVEESFALLRHEIANALQKVMTLNRPIDFIEVAA